MDWNPADEFSGRDPHICECCDGSGEIVFVIWVHEPGCGYGHESSDARRCEECNGTGRIEPYAPTMRRALEMDGEKLRAMTGNDHGPVFLDDDLPF